MGRIGLFGKQIAKRRAGFGAKLDSYIAAIPGAGPIEVMLPMASNQGAGVDAGFAHHFGVAVTADRVIVVMWGMKGLTEEIGGIALDSPRDEVRVKSWKRARFGMSRLVLEMPPGEFFAQKGEQALHIGAPCIDDADPLIEALGGLPSG